MKKLRRKGPIEISAKPRLACAQYRGAVSLASHRVSRYWSKLTGGRHTREQADVGPSGAIRLEVRTGYQLYRAIRKLSLGRQGLISRRGGRLARSRRLGSTLRRLSFEDCLDLGGARRPTGRGTGRCSRFDYGPAWKSSAIIKRAPWRR